MTFKARLITTVLFLVFAGNAMAHHAATVFDRKRSILKTGTVDKFIYRNPHLIINMSVNEPGKETVTWKIEGQSIAALKRMGFNRDSIHTGDKITVKMRPLRSG